jgi:hypothetical protein
MVVVVACRTMQDELIWFPAWAVSQSLVKEREIENSDNTIDHSFSIGITSNTVCNSFSF